MYAAEEASTERYWKKHLFKNEEVDSSTGACYSKAFTLWERGIVTCNRRDEVYIYIYIYNWRREIIKPHTPQHTIYVHYVQYQSSRPYTHYLHYAHDEDSWHCDVVAGINYRHLVLNASFGDARLEKSMWTLARQSVNNGRFFFSFCNKTRSLMPSKVSLWSWMSEHTHP